jgi:hypothetical protein
MVNNPIDEIRFLVLEDGDIDWDAVTPPSDINAENNEWEWDELDEASYGMHWLVWDTPGVDVTGMEFELKPWDPDTATSPWEGYMRVPHFTGSGEGVVAMANEVFWQTGFNDPVVQGKGFLLRKDVGGGVYKFFVRFEADVAGNYDRVFGKLDWQTDLAT